LLPRLSNDEEPARTSGVPSWMVSELAAPHTDAANGRFLRLPLLLLRMPAPLKVCIIDFLASTFDCRISPLRLGTRSLIQSWEFWVDEAGLPTKGSMGKDVLLTLGFYVPASETAGQAMDVDDETSKRNQDSDTPMDLGLKSIDIIIPASELGKFARAGREMEEQSGDGTNRATMGRRSVFTPTEDPDGRKRKRLAGGKDEEGWDWISASSDGTGPRGYPFTEALARYVDCHLALDMFHPGVRGLKIACGGFVLSETRLNLFALPGQGSAVPIPVWNMLARLVARSSQPAPGAFHSNT